MQKWQEFCAKYIEGANISISDLRKIADEKFSCFGVYPDSINIKEGSYLFIARTGKNKALIVVGKGNLYDRFNGEELTKQCKGTHPEETGKLTDERGTKVCPLSRENCAIIREKFLFTKPVSVLKHDKSIGLGDRLGLASAGHIRLFKKYPEIKPVLAQQSIRELNLTGRTYEGVLDDASWAVFQEGYTGGFGADGDHLKKPEEVKMALDCGFTMITLDCSEHIDNTINDLSDEEVNNKYSAIYSPDIMALEDRYLGKRFRLNGKGTHPEKTGMSLNYSVEFTAPDLKRIILIYGKAINFAIQIFRTFIKNYEREVDFEVSIDETLTPTSPQAHFFVASELISQDVKVATLAPRFCGEFQKGIDYIGIIDRFEEEFKIHAAIAEHLGYKISVHSGSDKFSIFSIAGKETKGKYHVKTAGTNWLEAVRVIAEKTPAVYRQIHTFALSALDEAKKYYHIGADTGKIPDIKGLSDSELPQLMNKPDSRQVLHITYGLILQAKNPDGSYRFRDLIYDILNEYEQDYYNALYKHINRHLTDLGGCIGNH